MNNILKYITIIALSVTVVSCNKWLDVKPKTKVDREAFYKSEAGFRNALVGCYVKMKKESLYGNNLTMTMIEFMAQNWENTPADPNFEANMKNFRVFKYDDLVVQSRLKSVYLDLYNVIVQANDILAYIETNGDVFTSNDMKNIVKGEALAIRAYCHFDILRLFGQMPNGQGKKVSLPYAEIASINNVPMYDFNTFGSMVIRDLKLAADLLKQSDPIMKYTFAELNDTFTAIRTGIIEDDRYAYRRTRLNYYAVKALEARANLYLGKNSEANACAKEVIEAKYTDTDKLIIALEDSQNDYTNGNWARPNDSFFILNIMNISSYADALFKQDYSLSARDSEEKIKTDLFNNETSDNRQDVWHFWASVGGTKQSTIKKYWQTKDISKPDGGTVKDTDRKQVPMIRLSEMYLIAIETETDIAKANALMKNFKISRGIIYNDLTAEELKKEVIAEYRREFFAEGQMFFVYKRIGADKMLWREEPVTPENYVVPVPITEINR